MNNEKKMNKMGTVPVKKINSFHGNSYDSIYGISSGL